METVSLNPGRFSSTNRDVARAIRVKVFKRDGWRCQVCLAHCPESARGITELRFFCNSRDGKTTLNKHGIPGKYTKFLTVDHIVPKSFGSTNAKENLVTLCNVCNNEKGNLNPFLWFEMISTGARKRLNMLVIRALTLHIMEAE